ELQESVLISLQPGGNLCHQRFLTTARHAPKPFKAPEYGRHQGFVVRKAPRLVLLIESLASEIPQQEILLGVPRFEKLSTDLVDTQTKRLGGVALVKKVRRFAERQRGDTQDDGQTARKQSGQQAAILNPFLHLRYLRYL